MKRKVTQEDLDLNPQLIEEGVMVGDEIEFEEELSEDADSAGFADGDDEDQGDDGLPHPPTVPIKP